MIHMFCAYAKHMSVLFFSYSSLIVSILELMISICRKLTGGWNKFELMVSICNFSNPPPTATPLSPSTI